MKTSLTRLYLYNEASSVNMLGAFYKWKAAVIGGTG